MSIEWPERRPVGPASIQASRPARRSHIRSPLILQLWQVQRRESQDDRVDVASHAITFHLLVRIKPRT
jgi:hypothetical protein